MNAAKHEPPPKTGQEDVLPLVLKDLEDRADTGFKKYGTGLQTHNGRDAQMDAYQEVLDLAMYLRQKMEEDQNISEDNPELAESLNNNSKEELIQLIFQQANEYKELEDKRLDDKRHHDSLYGQSQDIIDMYKKLSDKVRKEREDEQEKVVKLEKEVARIRKAYLKQMKTALPESTVDHHPI